MADQQPTVVNKGDDPLTVSAEQDVPDSETQLEETSLSDVILSTSMSTPPSVMNGEYDHICQWSCMLFSTPFHS